MVNYHDPLHGSNGNPGVLPTELSTTPLTRRGIRLSNIALVLAKPTRSNPRALADRVVATQPATTGCPGQRSPAPDSSISIRQPTRSTTEVRRILEQGDGYGRSTTGADKTVGVASASANPTSPLHAGHGHTAAIGDCRDRVLDATGGNVKRAFYCDNACVQMANLVISVRARARSISVDDSRWPGNG